jgi:outer membrane protein assembly factor BamD (BamD/ComL family)
LAEEVAALDRVRRLAAADPEQALRLLDEYDQRFPGGDLAPEALVLRIEALVRGGERARAETLARSFLSNHPRSPHAKRIRTIVGWSDDAR